ncbi:BspA family leucine-rich repeat surface protein [Lactobacillus sp. LC28-10]|uniref:BspA family leucine-rich repeat surface protein n=1 Tax=Secundilactobacillus angelensis TaxID=2722706 RepID=A0ABX1L222_9LACO|nr:BspA family leucine-rich repeat surface protein [Secundilactobacillus angelensis]MCH5463157.1 BspA family leucine-rich repeat surface protein [Secundilactobacillus angelensis]NLR19550.1 BspA family leucine-rich repeat surface protein [Secundilactobacillus angelensis]
MNERTRQQVAKMGSTVHYRSYKDGKQWLIVGVSSLALGVALLGAGSVQANASTGDSDSTRNQTGQITTVGSTLNQQQATLATPTTDDTNPASSGDEMKTDIKAIPTSVEISHAEVNTENKVSTKAEGEQATSTADMASTVTDDVKTTNLGTASGAKVNAAKTQAEQAYESTGQAQVITQTEPTEAPISGVSGTAPWTIDNGVLIISSGDIDGSGTRWSSDINEPTATSSAITSVKIAPNATVTVSGKGAASLFSQLPNVKTIDLTGLDTSAATSMKAMFDNDENLTSIIFGDKFVTSNVTDMKWMLAECPNLTNLEGAEKFDTSKVTTMYGMFEKTGVTSLDLSHYNTSKVTTMAYMFRDDEKLTSIDVSSFDTSQVIDFTQMFNDDFNLPTLDISNFNMKNVITEASQHGQEPNAGEMLGGTNHLWKLTVGPNVILTNALLGSAPGNNTPLPGSSTAVNYNRNWQIVGNGSDYAPAGAEKSAATLMGDYSADKVNQGETTQQTYVWAQQVPEQEVSNTYTVVNALTNQPISPKQIAIIQGKNGDAINISHTDNMININNTTINFPSNFYYASTQQLIADQKQPATSIFGKSDQSFNIYVIEAIPADPMAFKSAVPAAISMPPIFKEAVPPAISMPPIFKTAVPTPVYTTQKIRTSVPTPPGTTPTTGKTSVPTPPAQSTETEHDVVPNEPATSQHESTLVKQSGNQMSAKTDVDHSKAQGVTATLQSNNRQNMTHTQNTQKLPQTNETSHSLLTLIGLSLLTILGYFVSVFSKKKRHDG